MSAKTFIIAKSAQKVIAKLPNVVSQKVLKSLQTLEGNPASGFKLHGELRSYYKFRIGDYRIVYKFDSKKSLVEVLKVEHRQGVYR